jgi:hypothetical protein
MLAFSLTLSVDKMSNPRAFKDRQKLAFCSLSMLQDCFCQPLALLIFQSILSLQSTIKGQTYGGTFRA